MPKKPLRTKKYKLSLLDAESFIIIRLSDEKPSDVHRGASGNIAYECFEDSYDCKEEVFDDLCDREFEHFPERITT